MFVSSSTGDSFAFVEQFGRPAGAYGTAHRSAHDVGRNRAPGSRSRRPGAAGRASGNLGILLIGQKETDAAEAALQQALEAARRVDAHWLTAHLTGHLGVLAQDRIELDRAAEHYQNARILTKMIGDQRSSAFWTLNLGIVRPEQGRCDLALPLLTEGRDQAIAQGIRNLEAGAHIFYGSCLVSMGQHAEGLESIERGLALAAMSRADEARSTLQDGLRQAEASRMHRLGDFLRAELDRLPPP
jgi:tetratricopeptide (TPR) repeat protein